MPRISFRPTSSHADKLLTHLRVQTATGVLDDELSHERRRISERNERCETSLHDHALLRVSDVGELAWVQEHAMNN